MWENVSHESSLICWIGMILNSIHYNSCQLSSDSFLSVVANQISCFNSTEFNSDSSELNSVELCSTHLIHLMKFWIQVNSVRFIWVQRVEEKTGEGRGGVVGKRNEDCVSTECLQGDCLWWCLWCWHTKCDIITKTHTHTFTLTYQHTLALTRLHKRFTSHEHLQFLNIYCQNTSSGTFKKKWKQHLLTSTFKHLLFTVEETHES